MMAAAPWPHARLDAVGSVVTGGTPPTSDRSNYGRQHLFVSPADLGRTKYVRTSAKMLSAKGFAGSRRVPAGSTLFVCIGSTIGKVGLAGEDLATNQQINSIIPNGSVDPEFLFYATSTLSAIVREQAGEQAVPLVNKSQFSEFEIPMPPLVEQKEIATALADADDLIATLERLIAKKQAIKQGIMQQLLTGRTRLPGFTDSWRRVKLGELGTFYKGRGIKRDDVRSSGVPCIRYGELYTDFVNYTSSTRSFVSPDVAATALPIHSGDLLFAGSGETRDEIGMCVAYVGEAAAVAGGDTVVLRGNGFFNAVFLAALTNLPTVASQKSRAGQGDAVVHISSRALGDIQVEIPLKIEQDAIAGVIIDADRELAALERRLEKARAVKTGMMQELLTGRTRLPVEAAS
ncbi:restriction endonuclease subunit S [Mycolicibacterium conceptionense]|uniref:restriction endonuclease subunit S n=1 Tax=Mycolicibacterium conceptionense TaxID=451644 RepID=UPI0009BF5AF6|nr:restriction endonuclease subunit S [Mycolicibacterium conceptionense]